MISTHSAVSWSRHSRSRHEDHQDAGTWRGRRGGRNHGTQRGDVRRHGCSWPWDRSAPQDVVEQSAEKVGIAIPGEGESRDNRLAGLGPLSGTLVGVAVGALAGLVGIMLRERNVSVPSVVSGPAAILLIGAAAMALADIPMKVLGISDPQEWAANDWAVDAVPHLVYGVATYATLQAID